MEKLEDTVAQITREPEKGRTVVTAEMEAAFSDFTAHHPQPTPLDILAFVATMELERIAREEVQGEKSRMVSVTGQASDLHGEEYGSSHSHTRRKTRRYRTGEPILYLHKETSLWVRGEIANLLEFPLYAFITAGHDNVLQYPVITCSRPRKVERYPATSIKAL